LLAEHPDIKNNKKYIFPKAKASSRISNRPTLNTLLMLKAALRFSSLTNYKILADVDFLFNTYPS